MVKLSEIATDPKAEAEGVWLEYVPGFKVLIASSATREFRRAVDEALEPYIEVMRRDQGKVESERDFKDADRERLMVKVLARHVLRGWEGLERDDGSSDSYSEERAIEVLSDPDQHRFRKWVEAVSSGEEAFRRKRLESARKN